MPTGSIEVKADEIKIVNLCKNELPFRVDEFHNVSNFGLERGY